MVSGRLRDLVGKRAPERKATVGLAPHAVLAALRAAFTRAFPEGREARRRRAARGALRRERCGVLVGRQRRLHRELRTAWKVHPAEERDIHRDQDSEQRASAVRVGKGTASRLRLLMERRLDDDVGQGGGRSVRLVCALHRPRDSSGPHEAPDAREEAGMVSSGSRSGRLYSRRRLRRGDIRIREIPRREGQRRREGDLRRERGGAQGGRAREHERRRA